LLVRVLEQRPPSPASLRAGIAAGLARAVLRCLHKDPGARFQTYAALRRALQPYASSSPSPATLPLRFAAWMIDTVLLSLPGWAFILAFFGGLNAMSSPGHDVKKIVYCSVSFSFVVAYFGLVEGLRGASPGKALCRLRVVGLDGNTPGVKKGVARALLFCGFTSLPGMALSFRMLEHAADQRIPSLTLLPSAIQLVTFLVLFGSCRRRNGFAGLHDLWSETRVISRSVLPARPMLPPAPETAPAPSKGLKRKTVPDKYRTVHRR